MQKTKADLTLWRLVWSVGVIAANCITEKNKVQIPSWILHSYVCCILTDDLHLFSIFSPCLPCPIGTLVLDSSIMIHEVQMYFPKHCMPG